MHSSPSMLQCGFRNTITNLRRVTAPWRHQEKPNYFVRRRGQLFIVSDFDRERRLKLLSALDFEFTQPSVIGKGQFVFTRCVRLSISMRGREMQVGVDSSRLLCARDACLKKQYALKGIILIAAATTWFSP